MPGGKLSGLAEMKFNRRVKSVPPGHHVIM